MEDDLILGLDLTSTHATLAVSREGRPHLIPNAHGRRRHAFDFEDPVGSLATIFRDACAHLQAEALAVVLTVPTQATDDERLAWKARLVEAGWTFRRITNKPSVALAGAGVDYRATTETMHLVCERDGDVFRVDLMLVGQDVIEAIHPATGDDLSTLLDACLADAHELTSVVCVGGPWSAHDLTRLRDHTGLTPERAHDPETVMALGAALYGESIQGPIAIYFPIDVWIHMPFTLCVEGADGSLHALLPYGELIPPPDHASIFTPEDASASYAVLRLVGLEADGRPFPVGEMEVSIQGHEGHAAMVQVHMAVHNLGDLTLSARPMGASQSVEVTFPIERALGIERLEALDLAWSERPVSERRPARDDAPFVLPVRGRRSS